MAIPNKNIVLFFLLHGLWFNALGQNETVRSSNSMLDSVVTFASLKYQPHSVFRKILMGSNYRREWEQYVTVPVFYFSRSGFIIEELGGGMQTKSLRLRDSNGKTWSLRTVDKQVSLNLEAALQNSLGREIAQDLISSAFPYAVPLAGELAFAAGVNAARPKMFFVADDEALGEMRSIFSNTLCSLEERDPGFDKSFATDEMHEKLLLDNNYKIEQRVLLRARLLDILIGDWDRHEGNWRWGLKDSAGFSYYHAIPRDRDWSFYHSGGILPHLAQLAHNTQYFISFKARLKRVKELSYKSWLFDRTLLNELTALDWQTEIRKMQSSLTDSAIKKAVESLPKEIQKLTGEDLIFKLKGRRDRLEYEVMKYYRFVSEEIIVNGSDKNEIFSVDEDGGDIVVNVIDAMSRAKLYRRTISGLETLSVTLNGFGGDDVFEIDENLNSKIRFVIKGGKGKDDYNIKGGSKIKIYDSKADGNNMINKGNAKIYFN